MLLEVLYYNEVLGQ